MKDVSLLIPCHSEFRALEQKLLLVSQHDVYSEICVSISNPTEDIDYLALREIDPRIRIYICDRPTGLYENFRKLLMVSRSEFVCFSALDDNHPQALFTEAINLIGSKEVVPDLVVLPFSERNWSIGDLSWNGEAKPGPTPTQISRHRELQAIYCQASWFFSLWRRDFLTSVFPSREYDWLDASLVAEAIMNGHVLELLVETEFVTIGTRSGPPHSVGARHDPRTSLSRLFNLVSKSFIARPKIAIHFALVFAQRVLLAKRLNRQRLSGL